MDRSSGGHYIRYITTDSVHTGVDYISQKDEIVITSHVVHVPMWQSRPDSDAGHALAIGATQDLDLAYGHLVIPLQVDYIVDVTSNKIACLRIH